MIPAFFHKCTITRTSYEEKDGSEIELDKNVYENIECFYRSKTMDNMKSEGTAQSTDSMGYEVCLPIKYSSILKGDIIVLKDPARCITEPIAKIEGIDVFKQVTPADNVYLRCKVLGG